jgi:hypothetical protein
MSSAVNVSILPFLFSLPLYFFLKSSGDSDLIFVHAILHVLHVSAYFLQSLVLLEFLLRTLVLFLKEIQPIVRCVQRVDEDVSNRMETRFSILGEFLPREFSERVEKGTSLSIIVSQKVSNVNHLRHLKAAAV